MKRMVASLHLVGGVMDNGVFANKFPGVKRKQLEPYFDFALVDGTSSGRRRGGRCVEIRLPPASVPDPAPASVPDLAPRSPPAPASVPDPSLPPVPSRWPWGSARARAEDMQRRQEAAESSKAADLARAWRGQLQRGHGLQRGRLCSPPRSPERLEGTRTTGQIKFYIQEKGYGFIICKEVDRDVFFSRREVDRDVSFLTGTSSSWTSQFRGIQVEFKLDNSDVENPKAYRIKEVPVQEKLGEVIEEMPVEKIVVEERLAEVIKEVPVDERIVEVIKEMPVEKIVVEERFAEVIKEGPVGCRYQ